MRINPEWDVAVVGAGPAGATAAREAARQGLSVLLIDRASFPRSKVCGCCLNQTALNQLQALGLGELPVRLGARPLKNLHLGSGKRQARLPLPGGMALSRRAFDAALVEEAVLSGAAFFPETTALLQDTAEPDSRRLTLRHGPETACIRARVVLAADGLKGTLLAKPRLSTALGHHSRMGAGTIAPEAPDFYQTGTVFMACGKGGYAGLVRLEDGRLDIAAALDPDFVRQKSGPGQAAEALVAQAGFPAVEGLAELPWSGTPPLTRRCLFPAGERLFLLGDAAGYVEPFTGEGIAWALMSARAIGPLASRAARRWNPELAGEWVRLHRRIFARRQRICRWTAEGLRHPFLTRLAVAILSRSPQWAAPLVEATNSPWA